MPLYEISDDQKELLFHALQHLQSVFEIQATEGKPPGIRGYAQQDAIACVDLMDHLRENAILTTTPSAADWRTRITHLEQQSQSWPNVRNLRDVFQRLERLEQTLGHDEIEGDKPPLMQRLTAIEEQLMEP